MATNIKSLKGIDFSRPDFVFFIAWSTPLILLQFFSLDFFVDLSFTTKLIIISNILSFFIIYWIVKKTVKNKIPSTQINPEFTLEKVQNFFKFYFIVWSTLYIITIIYSGGIPLLWLLTGSGLTYYDFGIPTISGLNNMLRAFLAVIALILYTDFKIKKYIKYLLFFLATAFLVETSRGAGLVLLLHVLGYFFLTRKIKHRDVFKIIISSLILLLLFAFIEIFRYSNSSDFDFKEKYNSIGLLNESESNLSIYAVPAILYATTPLQNLNNIIAISEKPLYYPYYSTQSLVPSFIRQVLFENKKDYGDLLSEAYNTTTFYTPFIRDFGKLITVIIVVLLQVIVSYVHVKSKYSNLKTHRLLYPPLFMCVVLSPFNLYFTSLVVISYPIMVHLFIHHKKVIIKK